MVSPVLEAKAQQEHLRRQQRGHHFMNKVNIILIVISVILLGLLHIWSNNRAHPSTAVSMNTSYRSCPIVEYTLVEEGQYYNSAFQRYAAFEVIGGATAELTVKRWVEIIMSKSANNDNEKCIDNMHNLSTLIRQCPYRAVFFETKGVNSSNAYLKQFEFVLVDAPSLSNFAETRPNPSAFAEYLQQLSSPRDAGAVFSNLGGDANLVAPQNIMGGKNDVTYSHLAAFIRGAPTRQSNDLWRMVATEYNKLLQPNSRKKSIWLSTDGLGIAWLHFRLDSEPKYYTYKPFAIEY